MNGSQGKLASKDSTKDLAESDISKDGKSYGSDDKPKEQPHILKYIKTQVRALNLTVKII